MSLACYLYTTRDNFSTTTTHTPAQRHKPHTMPQFRMGSTVERLDRPSSYATAKVRSQTHLSNHHHHQPRPSLTQPQYKRKRRNSADRAPSPDPMDKLQHATTLYVGNLSFYTTEEQIHELFGKCGGIKRLIMGLDRFHKTPCGFCFVEYYTHEDALDCMKYVGGTKLDERIIRCDLDEGFAEGRQYGRGKSGGQVRDEYREEFDPGRGGFGKKIMEERERYADEYD